MNRCPITYQDIPDGTRYSLAGLKRLSPRLAELHDLPFSAEEQRQEAVLRAAKMSIQGVQPKLSARLSVARRMFEVVDTGGTFILKPQIHFPEVPQNEDLTMRLAAWAGIEVPLHGMIYSSDGSLTYFIKRFDRAGQNRKLHVEDFAQLSGKNRETKYDASMEQVAEVIERFCTFPLVEKQKLFRLILFNFLVGNEDMHLKNFSILKHEDTIGLSPGYDLLNTTIALGNAKEEIALPLAGKKRKLTKDLFLRYFAKERLRLSDVAVQEVLAELAGAFPAWNDILQRSFLSMAMKTKYTELLAARRTVLF